MPRHMPLSWLIGSIGVLTLAACGAASPAPTLRTGTSTPRSSATPTAAVSSTREAWTQRSPSIAPLPRNSAGFAYDAATGIDLLTGGRTGCGPSAGQYVDTWSWNGTAWTQLHPSLDGPGNMAWFTMAYDDATREEIAVGAYSGCGVATGMWTWNGSQWTQEPQSVAEPDAMASYNLAYDAASQRMILFGNSFGSSNGQPAIPGHEGPETWSWDGSHWTFLHPASSPPAVQNSAMAYDPASHQIVLVGGYTHDFNNDTSAAPTGGTWLWNGTTWTQAVPSLSPSPRYGASLAYDPDLGAVVLFGGATGGGFQTPAAPLSVFDDMWSWDGSAWTQLHPASLPTGRFYSQLTYDATNHELVLFGGSLNQNADANDTWVFRTS